MIKDGFNGQQPNADLISTLTRISDYSGLPITLHNRYLTSTIMKRKMEYGDYVMQYIDSFVNVVEYMSYQGLGLPTHDHAFYAQ